MDIVFFTILGLVIGFKVAQIIYRRRIMLINKNVGSPKSELEDNLWHEQETEFVFKLNERLSLSFERDKVAKHIVESMDAFLYVQKTVLLLLDKVTEEFKIGYAIGLEKDVIENFFLKKKEGISGFVMSGQRPLIVNDLDKDYYLKKLNKEDYLQKSFISVPFIFQKEVLGVLHVCDKKPNKLFSKRDFALMVNVGKVCAIAFKNVLLNEQIQDDYLKTITALASAIDARDHYTKGHSEDVARYSLAIAKEMKFSHSQTEVLRRAALLHDIGKIGIRDDVLLKSDNLTPEEYKQIKLHPAKGEEIVNALSFLKESSTLIRHHHEGYDGLGYPDEIKGEKIELGARVIAVADSFDAMTCDRFYRKALSLHEAIKKLEQNKGTQFDPEVVECFLKVLEKNPIILQLSHQKN